MLATVAPPRFVWRSDLPLLAPCQPARPSARQLPPTQVGWPPAHWSEVPGTRIATAVQWFAEFRHLSGKTLQLHSVAGFAFDPLPIIARIRLRGYAISLSRSLNGFEARWETAAATHRVWCSGSLASVMDLLYSFSWTESPTTAPPSPNAPEIQLSGR